MRRCTRTAVLATAIFVAACGQQAQNIDVAGSSGNAAGAPALPASGDIAAAVPAGRAIDDLAAAADRALREGRLYVPAGDNALEYWLEARARDPGSAVAASAVVELQPYLLIGCEQAIARHDFDEAHRLLGLLAASDPVAPALERLGDAIAAAEAAVESGREEAVRLAAVEAARQREDADARAAEQARAATARIAVAQAEAVRAAAGAPASAPAPVQTPAQTSAQTSASLPQEDAPPRPVAAVPSAAEPIASTAAADPPPQAAAPSPSRPVARAAEPPAAPAPPRALRQPPPRYPPLALARGLEGSVDVAFVIQPDGSVAGERVVDATPPGVFDRSALAAVAGYRFEASGRHVPSQVTLRFALNQ